jgi:hypothetical protein
MTNINGWFPGNKLRGIGYQLMVLSNGFMFIDMMRWLVDVDGYQQWFHVCSYEKRALDIGGRRGMVTSQH